MKLRAKLALTIVVAVIPLMLGLTYAQHAWRTSVEIETVAESVLTRMEQGGRARCEENPRRFGRPHRPGRRGRARRRPGQARGLVPYRADYRPSRPRGVPLPDVLRAALDAGDDVATTVRGPNQLIAIRMPWTDGPCAILATRRPAQRAPPLGVWVIAVLVGVLAALIAFAAAGPIVRRIRRLTRAVEAGDPIEATGGDELEVLAKTFQRQRGELTEQVEELQRRESALSAYVSNTTHDVMVPLTVLQGHLSKLRSSATAEDREVVGEAIRESHYLTSLVQNLGTAARFEAGITPMLSEPVSISQVVERVCARHRPVAREASVTLEFAVPRNEVMLQGDVTLLERALGNVVHNAIRYNDQADRGEQGHVAIVLEADRLEVLDDGPGMAAAERALVTEPRFRGGAARTRNVVGRGLGLAIVREVADQHGLTLTFQPNEPRGLIVRFDLP